MTTTTYQDVWELLERQLRTELALNWNPAQPVVLAVDSEKGGVGKTGLSGGLAAVMAAAGKRVLAIDLDPRGSFTAELDAEEGDRSVNDILYLDTTVNPDELPELRGLAAMALRPAGDAWGPNVQVLAAERALAFRESDNTASLEQRLRVALEGVVDQFDLTVIDLPPRAGGKLVAAGLLAATHVIYPGTLDEDGYIGVNDALRTGRHIAQTNPRKLIEVGVLRNIVAPVTKLNRLYDEKFTEAFGDRVLPVAVPRRIIRQEARAASVPITVASTKDARDLINGYTAVLNCVGKAKAA